MRPQRLPNASSGGVPVSRRARSTDSERYALVSSTMPPQSLDMVDSAHMLSFDDERWNHLQGGYKTPFDPRPSLRKLESQQDTATAWKELWEELHHQGDVGDALYASIPELVRIHRKGSAADWDLYGGDH